MTKKAGLIMEYGLIVALMFVAFIVILIFLVEPISEIEKTHLPIKEANDLFGGGHKERINRIIGERENEEVKKLLSDPYCTEDIRKKILGYYNPETDMFFMRHVDLFDISMEINNNKKENIKE